MTEEQERLLRQVEDDARKHMKKGHKGAAKTVLEYVQKVREELKD